MGMGGSGVDDVGVEDWKGEGCERLSDGTFCERTLSGWNFLRI